MVEIHKWSGISSQLSPKDIDGVRNGIGKTLPAAPNLNQNMLLASKKKMAQYEPSYLCRSGEELGGGTWRVQGVHLG